MSSAKGPPGNKPVVSGRGREIASRQVKVAERRADRVNGGGRVGDAAELFAYRNVIERRYATVGAGKVMIENGSIPRPRAGQRPNHESGTDRGWMRIQSQICEGRAGTANG